MAWSRIPPPPLKEPITPEKDKHFFEIARLFLAQTGQLSFDYLKEGKMAMLAKSVNLIRDIRGLDKKYSREVAKFAMIYVAPGQEDEGSIFRNSSGSMEYDEFVAALGWEVALADHPGYTGGLDSTMVIDGNARYYCTSTIEMIFHDLTKMPTDISDPKQLKKARFDLMFRKDISGTIMCILSGMSILEITSGKPSEEISEPPRSPSRHFQTVCIQ